MTSPSKRRKVDVMKLLMADYDVKLNEDERTDELFVKFFGPKDTPYEDGVWKVHVELPEGYPYKSPSIGFVNRMFHPNVDETSGSVCLDVINHLWSPMYDLTNIFDVFLPQLLTYPNPSDPLNNDAALLQIRDPDTYQLRVRDYVQRYARPSHYPSDDVKDSYSAARASAEGKGDDDADEVEGANGGGGGGARSGAHVGSPSAVGKVSSSSSGSSVKCGGGGGIVAGVAPLCADGDAAEDEDDFDVFDGEGFDDDEDAE